MATFKNPQQPIVPTLGPDCPEHEGPEPAREDAETHARWRKVRAARLHREQAQRGDPRWALQPRPERNPALEFYLAAGRHAQGRIRGCWSMTNVGYEGFHGAEEDTLIGAYWHHHGATITADAAAHDFEPWMVNKRRPRGRGFAAWRRAFHEAHRY